MSAAALVLGVIAAFFAIGIGVGVVAVLAMSALRNTRGNRRSRRVGPGDPDGEAAGRDEPRDPGGTGPRWPGG